MAVRRGLSIASSGMVAWRSSSCTVLVVDTVEILMDRMIAVCHFFVITLCIEDR